MDANREFTIKVLTLGDADVGKTCLFIRKSTGVFPKEIISTDEERVAFELKRQEEGYGYNRAYSPSVPHVHHMDVDGNEATLERWDTEGGEAYDCVRWTSYIYTDVVLLCFDLTNTTSYENIYKRWNSDLLKYFSDTPVVLIGTKLDLREDEDGNIRSRDGLESISYKQGQEMKSKIGAVDYFECSAVSGKGVDRAFVEASRYALSFKAMKEKKAKRCNIL